MVGKNDSSFKGINKILKKFLDVKDQISKAKEATEKTSESQIKINNKQALKSILETKSALNEMKRNVVIRVSVKNATKSSISNVNKNLKDIVSKPFNAVIKAKDQTKSVIDGIKKKMESLKKVFDLTIGEAMKKEDSFTSLKTNFKNEKDANVAFEWANNESNKTQFKASEVSDSVAKLAASGLDYKEYFTPLGNLATANNKSMNEAIEAMSKLSNGNLKDATSDFNKLGITKDMWKKQGIQVDKDGNVKGDSKQAMKAAVKIMNSNWSGAMKNKSNTASGQIKNIKEGFSSLGSNLVGIKDNGEIEKGGVFDIFKQQLSKILSLLDKFKRSNAFKLIKKDLNALVTVLTKIPGLINKHINTFKKSNAFKVIQKDLNNLILTFNKMPNVMNKYIMPAFKFFQKIVNKYIIPAIVSVFGVIKKYGPSIMESFKKCIDKSVPQFKRLWAIIEKNVIPIIQDLWKKVQEAMPGIRDLIEAAFKMAARNIKTAVDIFEKVAPVIEKMYNTISPVLDSVIWLFNQVAGGIKAAVDWLEKWNLKKVSPKNILFGGLAIDSNHVEKKALGTSYFSGGWSWVGEQGPELMKLPGGTQILDNRTSQGMIGGSLSIGKLADTLVVREDADIDRISDALAKKLAKVGFNCV